MIFDYTILAALIVLTPFSYEKSTHLWLVLCISLSIFIQFYYFFTSHSANLAGESYFLLMASVDFLAIFGLYLLKSRLFILSLFFISMLYNELAYLEYIAKTVGVFYQFYSEVMQLIMVLIVAYGVHYGSFFAVLKRSWLDLGTAIHHVFCVFKRSNVEGDK